MVSSTRRITESLSDHTGPQKQKYLLHSCSWTVHADQHFQWEGDNKHMAASKRSQGPSPITSFYIAPPAVRCNHIFCNGSFSALDQIQARSHSPAQVVSARYLCPLQFSQWVLKTKKSTQVIIASDNGEITWKLQQSVWNFSATSISDSIFEVIDWKYFFPIWRSKNTS